MKPPGGGGGGGGGDGGDGAGFFRGGPDGPFFRGGGVVGGLPDGGGSDGAMISGTGGGRGESVSRWWCWEWLTRLLSMRREQMYVLFVCSNCVMFAHLALSRREFAGEQLDEE